MTPEQQAAYINAQVACMNAELAAMQAANAAAVVRSDGVPDVEDDFLALPDRYGLSTNAVIGWFNG